MQILRLYNHLQERVFVLGTLSEPEDLRQDLGPYETIGLELAKECQEGVDVIWAHALLRHNTGELQRLRAQVRAILFSDD